MSDLFFRIAERALGLAPTLQPMVTPFYAPTQQQEDNDLFVEEALPDEARSDEGWQARATTGQHTHEPEQPREPTHLPKPELPRRLEHVRSTEPPSQQQHVHELEQPSQSQQTPMPVYPSLSHHAHELEQPSYPHYAHHEYAPEYRNAEYQQPSAPRPAFADPVDGERTQIGGGIQAEAALPPAVRPLTGTLVQVTTPEMGSRRTSTLNTDSPQTSTQKQALSRQTEQHTSKTEPESRQAAPTVHVTIGRIEVRATPAQATQAPAQRQQAAPKTMSLDEYLKQSGKGGGR